MFCSNCGKTVGIEDRSCPHCHIELGDVRFMGMPYTSVQFRIVPGKPMPIDEAYAYTRKDYSVDIENENAEPVNVTESVEGEDVENATTYRPVMPADPEQQEDEEEQAEEAEAAEEAAEESDIPNAEDIDPENLSQEQIDAALEKLRKRGVDTDSLEPTEEDEYQEETPDEGIAERLEKYERDSLEESERRQQKGRLKIRLPFGGRKTYEGVDDADDADESYEETEEVYEDEEIYEEQPAEETDIPEGEEAVQEETEAAEEYAEDEQAVASDEEYEQYGNEDDENAESGFSMTAWLDVKVLGIRLASILKVVCALIVLVVCLVLGLKWFGYVSNAQQKSPIDGVTLSLYKSGMEAITANAGDEKTDEMLEAYRTSGVIAFTQLQQQRADALKALMPEEPNVNDQLFMATLSHIQNNIANAVIAEAMSGDEPTPETRQNWDTIADSLSALKNAKDAVQLQAIINQKVEIVTTTPAPTPTPISYKVLTRGDEGANVKELQQRLFDLGYLADAPDGKFGSKTTTAIKYFQMGHDLNVTGIADSVTQERLFAEDALDMQAAKAAYQARQAESGN